MAKKRIFIASATESKSIAEKIAQALADAGHELVDGGRSFAPATSTWTGLFG